MLYERETSGSVDTICRKLTQAATDREFGVLGEHDLKQKMEAKGVAFGPQCRVLEVCNPGQAKKVLETNMAISTALPCRIAVYEEGGKVKVSTLRPTAVLGMYGSKGLETVAREVEDTIVSMIDAACR